jgi:hypothetical protein
VENLYLTFKHHSTFVHTVQHNCIQTFNAVHNINLCEYNSKKYKLLYVPTIYRDEDSHPTDRQCH